jgi:hypothetical protein
MTFLTEWDPKNKIYAMDLIQKLVERYGFLIFPKTLQDFRSANGAVFEAGKMGEIIIEKLTLYAQGIVIDTRSSTDDCELILTDAARWFSDITGVHFSQERITRKFYFSQLSFATDLKFEFLNPRLRNVSSLLSQIVSKYASRQVEYETVAISFQVDHTKDTVLFWQPMRIERLEGSSFDENRYFSAAPVPTNDHILLLREFEEALMHTPPTS